MAVKPRTVWFSDEEWAILKQVAQDRGGTISSIIRDFWVVAADPRPAAIAMANPTAPYSGPSFGSSRPAPKPGKPR